MKRREFLSRAAAMSAVATSYACTGDFASLDGDKSVAFDTRDLVLANGQSCV